MKIKLTLLMLLAVAAFGFAQADVPKPEGRISNSECMDCHADKDLYRENASGQKINLYVDDLIISGSVHRAWDCIDCHKDIKEIPHETTPKKVECSTCHEPATAGYMGSVHGKASASGDKDAPQCSTCHGSHNILPKDKPESRVYPLNLIKVCLGCHGDEKLEKRHDLPDVEIFKSYEKSVHGRALIKSGMNIAAVCNDCHGSHEVLPPDDPTSAINKLNIPANCGQCHQSILAQYKTSIHGKALEGNIMEAPVCTDCHGEHTIAKVQDPDSSVSMKNLPKTCAGCHEDVVLAEKYGIPAKRYATYTQSFHGVANKYGKTTVANCASCHGVHNILPGNDPASMVNSANLAKTCGKCHPGAGENFTKGKIHVEATPESSMPMYVVKTFYNWLITILVGAFVIYVAFDLLAGRRRRKKA